MTRFLRRHLLALALALAFVACSDDVAPAAGDDAARLVDAGQDVRIDSAVDADDVAPADVAPAADADAMPDAGADTAPDAPDADPTPDAEPDAPDAPDDVADAAPDARDADASIADVGAIDTGADADAGPDPDAGAPDATPDAAMDAAMDAAPDIAAPDTSPDATPDTAPAPTCDDGIINGDEIAVDCGGACVPDGAPTLDDVWNDVIARDCGGCHTGTGRSGGFGLGVNDGGVLDRLLARSVDVPSMPYITPCDVERSYFWHKCAGTQTSVGGSGRTMPTRGSLSAEQLALLRAWIEAGAPE